MKNSPHSQSIRREHDYYNLLGIQPNSSSREVRQAFLQMVRHLHPDRNPGDRTAVERFKEVTEAYRVLSNNSARLKYDCFGLREGATGSDAAVGSFNRYQQGNTITIDLDITLIEHVKGTSRTVVYSRKVRCGTCGSLEKKPCPLCTGTGKVAFDDGFKRVSRPCVCCHGTGLKAEPCRKCSSTGFYQVAESRKVRLEPGMSEGDSVKLPGMGHQGIKPGTAGNLEVVIHIGESQPFYLDNGKLWCDVPVPLSAAVLGGEVEVPTPWGWKTVCLESGTQPGSVVIAENLGLANKRAGTWKRDPLYLRIEPEIPRGDTPQLRALFRRLEEHENGDPSPARYAYDDMLKDFT